MIGITSIGPYFPRYRISEKMINEAWGRPGGRSERAVGYFDEDSLTMGISAIHSFPNTQEGEGVDGLSFSSTTSPFKEKMASTTMAMILDFVKRGKENTLLKRDDPPWKGIFLSMSAVVWRAVGILSELQESE